LGSLPNVVNVFVTADGTVRVLQFSSGHETGNLWVLEYVEGEFKDTGIVWGSALCSSRILSPWRHTGVHGAEKMRGQMFQIPPTAESGTACDRRLGERCVPCRRIPADEAVARPEAPRRTRPGRTCKAPVRADSSALQVLAHRLLVAEIVLTGEGSTGKEETGAHMPGDPVQTKPDGGRWTGKFSITTFQELALPLGLT
jgi:hypothetical protein